MGPVVVRHVLAATLGATLGDLLGAPVPLFAAMGFVVVFAGATNTPIACTIMGVELFGAAIIVLLAIGCVASYSFSAHRGISGSQRIDTSKLGELPDPCEPPLILHAVSHRRRNWLPTRRAPSR